jgi:guanylate kinase
MPESVKANLFVIAAPSGAGKTTLVKALVERNPDLRFSISYTTREKRVTEKHGRDYFFVNKDEFDSLKISGELLESALVFDNHYGTSRSQVEQHLENGDNVLLEIDWQGAQQVRESMPEAVSIFILPPSASELEQRLRNRKTDTDEVIARRLRDSLSDMSHWNEFGYVIVNDDVRQATEELQAVLGGAGSANRVGSNEVDYAVQRVLGT